MINSISSSTNAMSMMRSSAMQRQPPPPQGKDAFQVSDADGNGVVSQTELETLASGIEKVTGNSINVEDALSSFDADQDGGLNGEELLEMLSSNGFSPPEMSMSAQGESSAMAPPPPSFEQALSAYSQNSGDDLMAQLMDVLQQQDGTDAEIFSPIDVTS
jgi:hypothetical protein